MGRASREGDNEVAANLLLANSKSCQQLQTFRNFAEYEAEPERSGETPYWALEPGAKATTK